MFFRWWKFYFGSTWQLLILINIFIMLITPLSTSAHLASLVKAITKFKFTPTPKLPDRRIFELKLEILTNLTGNFSEQALEKVLRGMPAEYLEDYRIFLQALARNAASEKDPYGFLAVKFAKLGLDLEQTPNHRLLYQFVAGAIHPALALDLAQRSSNIPSPQNSRELLKVLDRFVAEFADIRDEVIFLAEEGIPVLVGDNHSWGSFESLQLLLVGINASGPLKSELVARVSRYQGWNLEDIQQLQQILRSPTALQTSLEDIPDIKTLVSSYARNLKGLGMVFAMKKHLPILRNSLMLARDISQNTKLLELLLAAAIEERRPNYFLEIFFQRPDLVDALMGSAAIRDKLKSPLMSIFLDPIDVEYQRYIQRVIPYHLLSTVIEVKNLLELNYHGIKNFSEIIVNSFLLDDLIARLNSMQSPQQARGLQQALMEMIVNPVQPLSKYSVRNNQQEKNLAALNQNLYLQAVQRNDLFIQRVSNVRVDSQQRALQIISNLTNTNNRFFDSQMAEEVVVHSYLDTLNHAVAPENLSIEAIQAILFSPNLDCATHMLILKKLEKSLISQGGLIPPENFRRYFLFGKEAVVCRK